MPCALLSKSSGLLSRSLLRLPQVEYGGREIKAKVLCPARLLRPGIGSEGGCGGEETRNVRLSESLSMRGYGHRRDYLTRGYSGVCRGWLARGIKDWQPAVYGLEPLDGAMDLIMGIK